MVPQPCRFRVMRRNGRAALYSCGIASGVRPRTVIQTFFAACKKAPATGVPLVPLTGLEPVRILLRGIFTLLYVAIAACMHRRCSPDFIFAMAVKVLGTRRKVSTRSQKKGFARYCPQSMRSSTEFDAIHAAGFPCRCSNYKSLASACSATAA